MNPRPLPATDRGPVGARPAPALASAVAHHVGVGLAITVPWLTLSPHAADLGVPPVLLLLGLVAVVLPPLAVVLVLRRLAEEGSRGGGALVRLGLARPSRRQVVRSGVPAVVAAVLLPAAGLPVEALLRRSGWLDGWPSTGFPGATGGPTSDASLAVALGVWVLVAVVVGPVVEELLFRGLLQPLLPGGPGMRVLGGSTLFAAYHLWQPAAWVTVFLATLPAAWVRERTGSTWLAAGVHVVANAVALLLLLTGAARR